MSYHDHARFAFHELGTTRPAPIFYRTRTPLWQRIRPLLVLAIVMAATVAGTLFVIAKMHATEAQLERVHAQGMAVGMTTCGRGE